MTEKLGAMLVRKGLINQQQLDEALKLQVIYGGRLGTNLVELNYLDINALSKTLCEQRGFPEATVNEFEVASDGTLEMLPASLAEKHTAFPLRVDGRKLVVAMTSPFDFAAVDDLGFSTGYRIVPKIAPELRIFFYLEKRYGIARESRYIRLADEPLGGPVRASVGQPGRPPVTQTQQVPGGRFAPLAAGEYLSADDDPMTTGGAAPGNPYQQQPMAPQYGQPYPGMPAPQYPGAMPPQGYPYPQAGQPYPAAPYPGAPAQQYPGAMPPQGYPYPQAAMPGMPQAQPPANAYPPYGQQQMPPRATPMPMQAMGVPPASQHGMPGYAGQVPPCFAPAMPPATQAAPPRATPMPMQAIDYSQPGQGLPGQAAPFPQANAMRPAQGQAQPVQQMARQATGGFDRMQYGQPAPQQAMPQEWASPAAPSAPFNGFVAPGTPAPTRSGMTPVAPPTLSGMPPVAPPTLSGMAPAAPPTLSGMPPVAPPTLSGMAPAAPPTLSGMPPVAPPTLSGMAPAAPPTLSGMPPVPGTPHQHPGSAPARATPMPLGRQTTAQPPAGAPAEGPPVLSAGASKQIAVGIQPPRPLDLPPISVNAVPAAAFQAKAPTAEVAAAAAPATPDVKLEEAEIDLEGMEIVEESTTPASSPVAPAAPAPAAQAVPAASAAPSLPAEWDVSVSGGFESLPPLEAAVLAVQASTPTPPAAEPAAPAAQPQSPAPEPLAAPAPLAGADPLGAVSWDLGFGEPASGAPSSAPSNLEAALAASAVPATPPVDEQAAAKPQDSGPADAEVIEVEVDDATEVEAAPEQAAAAQPELVQVAETAIEHAVAAKTEEPVPAPVAAQPTPLQPIAEPTAVSTLGAAIARVAELPAELPPVPTPLGSALSVAAEAADSWAMAIPDAPGAATPIPPVPAASVPVAAATEPAPAEVPTAPAAIVEPAAPEPAPVEAAAPVPAAPPEPAPAIKAAPEPQATQPVPAIAAESAEATAAPSEQAPAAAPVPAPAPEPAAQPAPAPVEEGLASPEELLAAAMAAGFFSSGPGTDAPPAEPAPAEPDAAPRVSLLDLPEPPEDAPREPEPAYRSPPGKMLVEELLARTVDGEKLSEALLWFCEGRFVTALLLTIDGAVANGWSAQGPAVDLKRVAELTMPLDQDSLIRDAVRAQAPVVRPEPVGVLDRKLFGFLGHHPRSQAAAVPIMAKGEPVAVLLGTRGTHPLNEKLPEDLEWIASSASRVCERLLLARKPLR